MLSSERREDSSCADGRVEAFAETLLGGGIEVAKGFGEAFISNAAERAFGADVFDVDRGLLLHAICVEKGAGEIDDGFTTPGHSESAGVGDGGDVDAFKVFLIRLRDEVIHFGGVDTDRHAFLRFRNGEFGAIESVVFLGDGIEIDIEAVGDFTDGDGDATCSEVVADFDFGSEFGISEEALDFALGGSVAFLDFG